MKKSIYPFVFFGMVALCFIACEKVEEDGFPEDQLIERKERKEHRDLSPKCYN